jgi:hypothetical protein
MHMLVAQKMLAYLTIHSGGGKSHSIPAPVFAAYVYASL